MFDKATYVCRRAKLKELVKSGIIILFGNNESPCNCPANGYSPFRQDSSFLYYFGLNRDGLVGVIDVDNDTETLIGNDIDIEDIVWFGSVDSVHDMAGACSRDRLYDAHNSNAPRKARPHGEIRSRSGGRHCLFIRSNAKLPDHLQPARRDYARQPLDGRTGKRTTGALRLRWRDHQQLLLGQHTYVPG